MKTIELIQEDYVSFEIAKLLKEKGFDEYCFKAYNTDGTIDDAIELCGEVDICNSECSDGDIAAPTLQMVMKWLREIYNIHIEVEVYYCEDGQMWLAKIQKIESANTILIKTCMVNNTYEQAAEAAIKYCLENLI